MMKNCIYAPIITLVFCIGTLTVGFLTGLDYLIIIGAGSALPMIAITCEIEKYVLKKMKKEVKK